MKVLISALSHEYLKRCVANKRYSSCFLLADSLLLNLYGDKIFSTLESLKIPLHIFGIQSGEQAKTLASAEACWEKMLSCQIDRHAILISFGGGTISDLAGFVASNYMRGIQVAHIPTTLLAMVDAAIGGKSAINFCGNKNLIGSFLMPEFILIDPNFLESLSDREYRCGLAEIIKYGVIWAPSLFEFLETHLSEILSRETQLLRLSISMAAKIKKEIIKRDPYDRGLRKILNYGHTFGHAIEAAAGFQIYSHGEAVSLGMGCAARTSLLLGYVDETFFLRQNALCSRAGLPIKLANSLNNEAIIQLMQGDKKNFSGNIRLILPLAVGKVSANHEVSKTMLREVLVSQTQ